MNKQQIKVQSPGRINIIGEHTDYNGGFVLPAAIDKKTVFQLQTNDTESASFLAGNINERFTFDLQNFQPLENGGWQNYIMGVVHELQKIGAKIPGFDAEFNGNVPIGGGLSSSASLECSLAFGLNELFNLGFENWQLIKASQMAEHNFVGIKCGIMDQFASVMGQKNKVMLLDCRSLEFKYFPFEPKGYDLLLLNTNVAHELATSEYNNRRSECEQGVEMIQKMFPEKEINSLRDVSFDMLSKSESELPELIFRRCKHVVTENDRVSNATAALIKNDYRTLGDLIYQSHFSLQNDYEVSCRELDFLVQETIDKDYILGSRVMGGGFGGCTINLVETSRLEEFTDNISKKYKSSFGIDLTPFTVSIEDGTSLI